MAREGLDENDRAIVRELLRDGHCSLMELSKRTGLLAAALSKRISRLKAIGVIEKYTLNIDYVRAGFAVTALLLVRLKGSIKEFDAHINKMPNVVEAYRLLGQHDYCLKIICDTNQVLMDLTQDVLTIEGVVDAETIIVAARTKNDESELFRGP